MENKPAIEISNLSYSYPDGKMALEGVSLTIREGESVALIGANGAGKSTLLLHLNSIFNGGPAVKIMGMESAENNIAAIRKAVGLVFQDPDSQLFMPTLFDDVAFGPINMKMPHIAVDAAVKTALDRVDLAGYETRNSHHLSFGEKKRASLATVLSMDAKILALDEPSANLDPRHRRELIALLKELKQTKVIATHDIDMVEKVCERVVLMKKGKIVADGKTGEIISDLALLEINGL